MIECTGLSKSFNGQQVVQEVSLKVVPGQVLALVGPNGAGKTSILRMLAGLCRPDSGSAAIDGLAVNRMTMPARTVGISIDSSAPYSSRTVFEHLNSIALALGCRKVRVLDVLAEVDLSLARNKKIKHLSLGMKQRLSLAGALLAEPANIILDEPLNGLDPEGIRWFRGLVQQWRSENRSVLISSHIISELVPVADQIAVVRDGRLAFSGPVEDLTRLSEGKGFMVRTVALEEFRSLLDRLRIGWERMTEDATFVESTDIKLLVHQAVEARIPLYEVIPVEVSLENAYFSLAERTPRAR